MREGSLKLYVSFVKEPYKTDDILHKRPVVLRNLAYEISGKNLKSQNLAWIQYVASERESDLLLLCICKDAYWNVKHMCIENHVEQMNELWLAHEWVPTHK